jgi:hypothetical protein
MASKKAVGKKKKTVKVEAPKRKRGQLSAQVTFRVSPTLRTWLDRRRSKYGLRGIGEAARAVLEAARKASAEES